MDILLNLGPPDAMDSQSIQLQDCWAKTDDCGRPAVSVRDHSLNVGAVGKAVAERLPENVAGLFPVGGLCLIAMHDIGKVSPGFLLKSPAWRAAWQERLALGSPETYEGHHAKLGQHYLGLVMPRPSRWIMAVGGHHGCYPCRDFRWSPLPGAPLTGCEIDWVQNLRRVLFLELQTVFGGLPSENVPGERGARLHWFTGLLIFCDWIGSNTTWFPSASNPATAADSDARAADALDELGWHRRDALPSRAFKQLFGLETPNALQQSLIDAADSPGVYIVEAPMGEGKTEAALALAYRRWSAGTERGLFFALPTQLTSNRIHDRVGRFLAECVADRSAFSLVHGNAWLRDDRIQALSTQAAAGDRELEDQALAGNRWFSDSRRAMLAPFGVGTLDQALMSVVAVKFSALRLFALSGKVVVIDEVHSYDPYTSTLVDRLVSWLLEVRCSVVILSATLTHHRRAALVRAAGAQDTDATAYPLITKVAAGEQSAHAITIPGPARAPKRIEVCIREAGSDAWVLEVVNAATNGACVVVVRNTVALAQSTFKRLKSACPDTEIEFGCLHSRFTAVDRDRNESRWMELLGRHQGCRPAAGAVLVGTQVLEQSVDIDADLLITDVAPTDLILQRIGRLHRHNRHRPAVCATPRCVILDPPVNWNSSRQDLLRQLRPHRFVYPPFTLYMARRIWAGKRELSVPTEIREVLEASALPPDDLPTEIRHLHEELLADVEKMSNTALRTGPFNESALDDIDGTQTRWRPQPTAHMVLLARPPRTQAGLTTVEFPDGQSVRAAVGRFDFHLARLIHQHAIRVPAYLVNDLRTSAPDWVSDHLATAVAVWRDDSGVVHACHGPEQTAFGFTYRSDTGMEHSRNQTVTLDKEQYEEDFEQ